MKAMSSRYNQHSFAQLPQANVARSKFDRSFSAKDTHQFDYINPIFIDEIVPGDSINLNVKAFIRLATQVVPFMDNVTFDFFSFFVPSRTVWDNFEKFMGAQDNPGESTDYLIPTITSNSAGFAVGSIYDKMGIPTGIPFTEVNALPFRAVNFIWNEWFRDQNLQNSLTVPKGDGPDLPSLYTLRKRAKPHDYFTSALPWPQKGQAVELPLGGIAPVYPANTDGSGGFSSWQTIDQTQYLFRDIGDGANTQPSYSMTRGAASVGTTNRINDQFTPQANWVNSPISNVGLRTQDSTQPRPTNSLFSDLTEATAATINQLRQAMMMQSLLELDARGGTRYVEIIRSHFNVVSPDFRLQRPEFLGGGRITLNQHPVAQTSESATTPQANLAAFSTASATGNNVGFSKSFVEHGYVIIFMQARGDVTYQQGLNKIWSRQTRWDFFWPKFQELGEQAILNKEIYLQAGDTHEAENNSIFGYIPRYDDMRFRPSEIRGQFRSTFAQTLDVWHLAQEFGSLPMLSSQFIEANTPIERTLEVVDANYPHLLCDFWFDYKHARPMMTYAIPATLGRF